MLNKGDKVLVMYRRLYKKDLSRFFVGTVLEYDLGLAKVEGYTHAEVTELGKFIKKGDSRIKILPLVAGTIIVYELPATVKVENIEFVFSASGALVAVDKANWSMDLSEVPRS